MKPFTIACTYLITVCTPVVMLNAVATAAVSPLRRLEIDCVHVDTRHDARNTNSALTKAPPSTDSDTDSTVIAEISKSLKMCEYTIGEC